MEKALGLVRNRGSVLLWCPVCNRPFTLTPGEVEKAKVAITCGRACRAVTIRGEANYNWRGGRQVNPVSGYVYVRVDGKYRLEHRVVMEEKLGRTLTKREVVHHDNEVRSDNAPDNLVLSENAGAHMFEHHGVYRDAATRKFRRSVAGE